MIIEKCRHYGGKCPCLYCKEKCYPCINKNENGLFDTENLCEKARSYCESDEDLIYENN